MSPGPGSSFGSPALNGSADPDEVQERDGRQAAERLGIPLYRVGFPVFDRLGVANRVSVGYRGTRDLIFRIGNILIEAETGHGHGSRERAHDGFADAPLAVD